MANLARVWGALCALLLVGASACEQDVCGPAIVDSEIELAQGEPPDGGFPYMPEGDDLDGDGWVDDFDNCPYAVNRDQADGDGDGFGDACDNCPGSANVEQADADGDRLGNSCDADADDDGVLNNVDSCWLVPNPGQIDDPLVDDVDNDGVGNVCDTDDDNDSLPDVSDPCPQIEGETDPTTEGCDSDADDDGIPDSYDGCPTLASADNRDSDADFVGDACDPDLDNDGVPNAVDNCRTQGNASQLDADRDGIGDACDPSFCYVVDSAEAGRCLDPTERFLARPGPDLVVPVGERVPLRLYTNRPDQDVRYWWQVLTAPPPVSYLLTNPEGTATESSGWRIDYPGRSDVTFVPYVSGDYEIEVKATLLQIDSRFPAFTSDQQVLRLSAEGVDRCAPDLFVID